MSKSKVWQIIACNEDYGNIEDAARLQREKGWVSVGWAAAGDLTKLNLDDRKTRARLEKKLRKKYDNASNAANCLKRFKWLSRSNWVILYKNKTQIACVGRVVNGKYKYNTKNSIGNGEGFGYSQPHQLKVKWRKSPINFSVQDLPEKFSNIGVRGTIHEVHGKRKNGKKTDFPIDKLVKELKKIPTQQVHIDEPAIKGYLRMFVGRDVGWLERGLKLTRAEPMTHPGRADFLAEKNNKKVLIEVKTHARAGAIKQLRGYMKGERIAKGILLARSFDENVKDKAKPKNISCFRCAANIKGKWVAMRFTKV